MVHAGSPICISHISSKHKKKTYHVHIMTSKSILRLFNSVIGLDLWIAIACVIYVVSVTILYNIMES